VGASVKIYDSLVCFVAAHLAAHEGKVQERDEQFHELAERLLPLDVCTHMLAHDSVLFCGDLNYRLARIEREMVEVHARYNQHEKMVACDELCDTLAQRRAFDGFSERPIGQQHSNSEKKKVLSIVTLFSTYAMTLTFQNVLFRSGTSGASVLVTGCSSTRQ